MKSISSFVRKWKWYNQAHMSLVRTGDIKVIFGSACAASVEMVMF